MLAGLGTGSAQRTLPTTIGRHRPPQEVPVRCGALDTLRLLFATDQTLHDPVNLLRSVVRRATLLVFLAIVLAGCAPRGLARSAPPRDLAVAQLDTEWRETRFSTGCEPGPFTDPPATDGALPSNGASSAAGELSRSMHLSVDLASGAERAPLLGTGFNLEHGLWSCGAFRPVLEQNLLEPFRPALARIDTGLLPAAPADLPAWQLNRRVYQSVLASEPYAGQWQMIRELDNEGVRVVLGVWGGPDQFTDDGTRRGTLLARHYDDYVEYVVSIVDFLVARRHLPISAITIANEPDGGDGNQIPPDGFAYIAHQLAIRLDPYGVQLYGPDTTSADAAMDYLPSLLADPVVADHLAFVGFHQYSGDPSVSVVSDYVHAQQPGLPVVITEYTSFSFGDLDGGQEASSPLDFTLDVADTVLAHYRFGADAALYWDAVDYLQPGHDAITRWGLLRSPAEDFAPRKWYYGLIQILPYLQPGARVLETERYGGDDLGLLAVRTVDQRLALFFVNEQDAGIDVDLELTGPSSEVPAILGVTQTDATATAAPAGALAIVDGETHVHLPGRSVTTLLSS